MPPGGFGDLLTSMYISQKTSGCFWIVETEICLCMVYVVLVCFCCIIPRGYAESRYTSHLATTWGSIAIFMKLIFIFSWIRWVKAVHWMDFLHHTVFKISMILHSIFTGTLLWENVICLASDTFGRCLSSHMFKS